MRMVVDVAAALTSSPVSPGVLGGRTGQGTHGRRSCHSFAFEGTLAAAAALVAGLVSGRYTQHHCIDADDDDVDVDVCGTTPALHLPSLAVGPQPVPDAPRGNGRSRRAAEKEALETCGVYD